MIPLNPFDTTIQEMKNFKSLLRDKFGDSFFVVDTGEVHRAVIKRLEPKDTVDVKMESGTNLLDGNYSRYGSLIEGIDLKDNYLIYHPYDGIHRRPENRRRVVIVKTHPFNGVVVETWAIVMNYPE